MLHQSALGTEDLREMEPLEMEPLEIEPLSECSVLHAERVAKGLLHAKLCVEIAKTNSVLAATAQRPPGSSAFSKQPPTKSPDIYFAQVQSRESVRCSAIILLRWKLDNFLSFWF